MPDRDANGAIMNVAQHVTCAASLVGTYMGGMHLFPIPRNGDVVRCIELYPMDEVIWAVLEVADSIAWKWEIGTVYTPPPSLNMLAIGDHTCTIKICQVENTGNTKDARVEITAVFDLFNDIEKRRRMASVDKGQQSWFPGGYWTSFGSMISVMWWWRSGAKGSHA